MIQAAATMHLIWGQSYEKLRVVKTAFKLPYSEKANCFVVKTRLCFVLILQHFKYYTTKPRADIALK